MKNEHRASVYDLNPKTFGSFDLVSSLACFTTFGIHCWRWKKFTAVCTGTLLMQTATSGDSSEVPRTDFHPFRILSRPIDKPSHDPTCFSSRSLPAAP